MLKIYYYEMRREKEHVVFEFLICEPLLNNAYLNAYKKWYNMPLSAQNFLCFKCFHFENIISLFWDLLEYCCFRTYAYSIFMVNANIPIAYSSRLRMKVVYEYETYIVYSQFIEVQTFDYRAILFYILLHFHYKLLS